MAAESTMPIRPATSSDIPVLVKHRRWMFEEMMKVQPVIYTMADLDTMEEPYRRHLDQHLKSGTLRAWVVEDENRIVASGALELYLWPPRPGDVTERAGLVHSVYVARAYRRRGLARRIMDTIVDAGRAQGLKTVTLHSSDAGRHIYETMGFHATSEMRLTLR